MLCSFWVCSGVLISIPLPGLGSLYVTFTVADHLPSPPPPSMDSHPQTGSWSRTSVQSLASSVLQSITQNKTGHLFFFLLTFIYLMYVHARVCHRPCLEDREQLAELSSLFPSCSTPKTELRSPGLAASTLLSPLAGPKHFSQ